ncbi:MAG: hypothetical protein ACREQH_08340 [Candidatus Binatus sp.]
MRRGQGSSWLNRDPNDPLQIATAVEDLIRKGDVEASFFKVESCDEIKTVAELFSTTVLQHPQTNEFLMVPGPASVGVVFKHSPDPSLHPYLRVRHFELQGLLDREYLHSFIGLSFGCCSVFRFLRKDLIRAFCDKHFHDAEVTARCGSYWLKQAGK